MSTGTPAAASPVRASHLGLLVLLWLVWGSSWPAMRVVFQELPIWQFRAVTSLGGGLALLLMARLRGGAIRLPREIWLPLTIAAFFNITVWHVAVGYGLSMIGAGHAAVVCYTLPVWTALLSAIFLKERLGRRILVSIGLGMAGVAVLASHDFAAIGAKPVGLAFVLGASICWAIGTILIKQRRWGLDLYALAGWQLLIGMVPIAIIAIATEEFTLHQASPAALLAGGYSLFVGIIAGYALWFKVVSLFSATAASISALVTPVIGMASGALFLGEPLGWREGVALVAVLGAVALVNFFPGKPAPAGAAAAPGKGTAS